MVLVQAFIDVGYLPLAESIVQGVVDILDGNAEAAGGVAVNGKIRLQTFVLLVGIDVAQFGNLPHAGHQDGSPVIKVLETVRLQSVLKLRGAPAASNGNVLHGLQEKRSPGNSGNLPPETLN